MTRARGVLACLLVSAAGLLAGGAPADESATGRSAESRRWFQETEQALMDAVALGDKAVWDRVLDAACVVTSEEGLVTTKQQLLADLRPLPAGLSGSIVVRDLTLQEYPAFAIVHYLADESESVFGQTLSVRYRVSNTYRRDGAAWKMVAAHTSVVTQDPPRQPVSTAGWPGLVGSYRLLPAGWTFTVEMRDGGLYGGRDPKALRPMVPLTPTAFVLTGSLGEWLFVVEQGKATRIVNLRKFAVLVWDRVSPAEVTAATPN